MPDSIDTQTENWCIAQLAHNPSLLAKFWDRLTPGLFVSGTAKALHSAIRSQWAAQGSMDDLVLARLCPIPTDAMDVLFAHSETWTMEGAFEMQLSLLEDSRTLRDSNEIGELLAKAQSVDAIRELKSRLESIVSPQAASKHTVNMKDSYNVVVDELQDALQGKPRNRGVRTKIPMLNSLTGGLCPGKLWIICGETSDGKSVLAQNLATAFADASQTGVIYSWEMPDTDITRRAVADVANVSLDIYSGDVQATNADLAALGKAGRWVKDHGSMIEIVNASSLSFHDVCADIRIKSSQRGIKFVVIDYLQLMDLNDLDRAREQQIAKACASLYRLASALGFTLIILSQLNDEGKLRESRSPGMDCDVMLTIQKVMKEDGESDERRRNVWLSKNRGGQRFVTIPCVFDGAHARFSELDRQSWADEAQAKQPAKTNSKPKSQWARK